MLNQIHTAVDIAADRRRSLEAEADAYRLARMARRAASTDGTRPARRRGWLQLLRFRPGRAPA
ncbi:hypothetical protein K1T35_46210 [Pseudonocardia sp. DSM 110487]|jgi:hypothetical protein|uniref:hypothetical protein n=1 Tax=Pseudonocardia sp. DSM 110487 TaxID=2865833 RepID=UPI001C69B589|nr:hypothetical protein [Pseudonocardia sp. DSM 110487]QYN35607.1 hypothetical protein K1T35_46210 [Pseudonocardia sp. DSM 110487]